MTALLRCKGIQSVRCSGMVVPVVDEHNDSVKVIVEVMPTMVHVFVLAVIE